MHRTTFLVPSLNPSQLRRTAKAYRVIPAVRVQETGEHSASEDLQTNVSANDVTVDIEA